MTMITNLTFSNASVVFTSQNAYTSMELYYVVVALFSIFAVASFFLNGYDKPFEKLFAAIIAFIFSIAMALTSFSLAIVGTNIAGNILTSNTTGGLTASTQLNAIVPTIIMQNGQTWQIISWILVLLAFVNIINCILVLIDFSRIKGVKNGAL